MFTWPWELCEFMQGPLKVGTECIMLHIGFFKTIIVEVFARICKGLWRKWRPKLLTLRGEGEHMVHVTQVLHPSTHVMRYESRRNPLVATLEDACTIEENIYILWECQYLMPMLGWWNHGQGSNFIKKMDNSKCYMYLPSINCIVIYLHKWCLQVHLVQQCIV
jgi:hypothetical protein